MTVEPVEGLADTVRAWIQNVVGVGVSTEGGLTLEEIGLDSLSLVDLSRMLRRAGVDIEPAELDYYATVDEVVALVVRKSDRGNG